MEILVYCCREAAAGRQLGVVGGKVLIFAAFRAWVVISSSNPRVPLEGSKVLR